MENIKLDIFKEFDRLGSSLVFKKFLRDFPGYYLVHVLVPDSFDSLEFGFFNSSKNKMVVFRGDPFVMGPEEDVFKEGRTISKLDLSKVSVSLGDVLKGADEVLKKEFSAEVVNKRIIILQTISCQVWNLTFVCKSLNVINLRFDAESFELLRKDKSSLLSMAGLSKS